MLSGTCDKVCVAGNFSVTSITLSDLPCPNERLVVVEPLIHMSVFLLIELHLHGLQWLYVQHIVSVVKGRLLIVKWRESHPLKVTSVTLLTTHHDPHGPALGDEGGGEGDKSTIHLAS